MLSSGPYAKVAKLTVTALVKSPGDAAEAVLHGAIDRLFGWLEGGEHERLIRRVGTELERLAEVEFGGKDRLVPAATAAEVLFKQHGLSAAELVECCLEPERADALLLERGAEVLRVVGDDAVVRLCRERIVPGVHRALLDDPEALKRLQSAIFRALLAHGDEIKGLRDEVGRVLRRMTGRGLLTDQTRLWRPGLPPTALLRAEYGVVPFHEGREALIGAVLAWCEDDEPVKVRLFTGAGGIGKTRLMIELCQRLRGPRWRAGFLDKEAARAPAWALDALLGEGRDLFLVVDYAETRRDVLEPLLRRATLGWVAGCLRVVLVARAKADWWRALQTCDADVAELLDDGRVIAEEVRPLADGPDQRRRVFARAAEAFSDKIDRPSPPGPPPDLSAPHFAAVLFLHIAALASVGGEVVRGEQKLLDYVLDRERRAWEAGLVGARLTDDLDVEAVRQTAALVTLAGGTATRTEARKLVTSAPLLGRQTAASCDRLVELLHRLYPGESYLEGVQPDLLGERIVKEEIDKDPSLLDIITATQLAQVQIEHALIVLARIAEKYPHALEWLRKVMVKIESKQRIDHFIRKINYDKIWFASSSILLNEQTINILRREWRSIRTDPNITSV